MAKNRMTGPVASSGDVDLARLLVEEPDSAAEEFQAYAVLRGPTQPLTSFVKNLVIANDVATLDDLARRPTPLHTLLRRRVPPHVRVADELGPPYANRDPAPVAAGLPGLKARYHDLDGGVRCRC